MSCKEVSFVSMWSLFVLSLLGSTESAATGVQQVRILSDASGRFLFIEQSGRVHADGLDRGTDMEGD